MIRTVLVVSEQIDRNEFNSSYVSNGVHSGRDPNALPGTSTPPLSKYEPYFDPMTPRNVTALVGNSAYLTCIVKNLANKTLNNVPTFLRCSEGSVDV
ncbi:hypothetical protein RUM43_003985 [Polyplax serrata]|uniref:Ig-like domain-containing protein n=1 Tax=Polyplax serrata TaxID=468196 RepID=A0AAN8SAE6_POLSC